MAFVAPRTDCSSNKLFGYSLAIAYPGIDRRLSEARNHDFYRWIGERPGGSRPHSRGSDQVFCQLLLVGNLCRRVPSQDATSSIPAYLHCFHRRQAEVRSFSD